MIHIALKKEVSVLSPWHLLCIMFINIFIFFFAGALLLSLDQFHTKPIDYHNMRHFLMFPLINQPNVVQQSQILSLLSFNSPLQKLNLKTQFSCRIIKLFFHLETSKNIYVILFINPLLCYVVFLLNVKREFFMACPERNETKIFMKISETLISFFLLLLLRKLEGHKK